MNGTAQLKRAPRNQDVRAAIDRAGLRYWWVAEELGIACGTLSNHLRKELPPEEREAVLTAVRRLAERLGAPAPASPRREMTLETRSTVSAPIWQ